MSDPTKRQYSYLDGAYDFFNKALFNDTLPRCLITMQRHGRSRGFFHGERFVRSDGIEVADEIALNPALFRTRTTEETLSTLVHEMAHLWQHHLGTPPRTCYHNKEWADKMDSLGLIASNTGEPGGKRTGQQMTHYIEPGGPFDRQCKALIAKGFVLPYVQQADDEIAAKKGASKTKFTCPVCKAHAWGKPDLLLICGSDQVAMASG